MFNIAKKCRGQTVTVEERAKTKIIPTSLTFRLKTTVFQLCGTEVELYKHPDNYWLLKY